MAARFNADEVFEMAKQIERNGGRFYRRAVELATEAPAKALFERLAEMEADHERTFDVLQRAVVRRGASAAEVFVDPDGQGLQYIQGLADDHVFGKGIDPTDLIAGIPTTVDLINMARRFERDSITFFEEIKKSVPEDLGRDSIDALIEEERQHLAMMQDIEAELG